MNTVCLTATYTGLDFQLKGKIFAEAYLKGAIKLAGKKVKANIFTEKPLTGNVSTEVSLIGVASVGLSSSSATYPFYKGEYEVVPKRQEQIIDTNNKILTKDITIVEIPYSEVSNLGGGKTFYIARE